MPTASGSPSSASSYITPRVGNSHAASICWASMVARRAAGSRYSRLIGSASERSSAKVLSVGVPSKVGVQRPGLLTGSNVGFVTAWFSVPADQVAYPAVDDHLGDCSLGHPRWQVPREGVTRFVIVVVGVEQAEGAPVRRRPFPPPPLDPSPRPTSATPVSVILRPLAERVGAPASGRELGHLVGVRSPMYCPKVWRSCVASAVAVGGTR